MPRHVCVGEQGDILVLGTRSRDRDTPSASAERSYKERGEGFGFPVRVSSPLGVNLPSASKMGVLWGDAAKGQVTQMKMAVAIATEALTQTGEPLKLPVPAGAPPSWILANTAPGGGNFPSGEVMSSGLL